MRKKLSIVQIILGFISLILPFTETMFLWKTYTIFENRSETTKSLYDIMTVQLSDICGLLFWFFIIILALVIVYFVADIFVGEKIPENNIVLITVFIPLTIMIIMIAIAANYKDTSSWQGEFFNIAVISTIVSYIEVGLLVSIPVIECYKKFKVSGTEPIVIKPFDEAYNAEVVVNDTSETLSNADELKKFKELLDMGAITQEEFDAKKKELLGL